MKLLVGIPTFDRRLDIDLFKTLLMIERQNKHHLDYLFPVSSHLSRNRNYVCSEALKGDYDGVLFLDSDIGIKDESFIDKLIEAAYRLDAKVVGGTYRMKKPNEEYILIAGTQKEDGKFDNLRNPITHPLTVDGIGTGIMLIYREVLEKMTDPWFTIVDKPKLDVLPEDFYFCEKAKKLGYKIALTPMESVHFGHYGWST